MRWYEKLVLILAIIWLILQILIGSFEVFNLIKYNILDSSSENVPSEVKGLP